MTIGIITTCHTYHHFLPQWSDSITKLERIPDKVIIASSNVSHEEIFNTINKLPCETKAVKIQGDKWNFADGLNTAISECDTDWICWIGCDDWYLPHALSGWENSEFDVVSFGLQFPDGSYVRQPIAPTKNQILNLSNKNLVACGSPFKKYLWEKTPFQRDLSPYEDWAFMVGAAVNNAKFGCTERIDYIYRVHAGQIRYEDAPIERKIAAWRDKMLNG